MEYIPLNLELLMKSAKTKDIFKSQSNIVHILYQLLRGVQDIHDAGAIHRNLKPSNILINENGRIKITDFNQARVLSKNRRGRSPNKGTRAYRAPEVCLEEEYDKAADVFSLGCILYELMKVFTA